MQQNLADFNKESNYINLPFLKTKDRSKFLCKKETLKISSILSEKIKINCEKNGLTMSDYFLAISQIFLGWISSQDEISLGLLVENTPKIIKQNSKSSTLDLVIFKAELEKNCKLLQLIKRNNTKLKTGLNTLNKTTITSNHVNNQQISTNLNVFYNYNLIANLASHDINNYKFDLLFSFFENQNNFECSIYFNNYSFDIGTIIRFLGYIEVMLNSSVKDFYQEIHQLETLPTNEKHRLLYEFNNTKADYPRNKTIVELFSQQAKIMPDKVIAEFERQQLTYAQADYLSDLWSQKLLLCNTKTEDIILIFMDNCIEIMIAIPSILRAGGAYLILDIDDPEERIKRIIQDARVKIVLTTSSLQKRLDWFKGKIFCLDFEPEKQIGLIKQQKKIKVVKIKPTNLAAVYYTSGSTGEPKGVMLEHRAMVCHVYAKTSLLGLNENNTISTTSKFNHCVPIYQTIAPLLFGIKFIIYSKKIINDPEEFFSKLFSNKINHLDTVPSRLKLLFDYYQRNYKKYSHKKIKSVLVAGDRLYNNIDKNKKFFVNKLINSWGTTESCADNTFFNVFSYQGKDIANIIPIGQPTNNLLIYILDACQRMLPIGVAGHICIGGERLSRGYYKKLLLTKYSFYKNPFDKKKNIYNTRDFGRWLDDGNIDFIGRKDMQVKIFGYRIELREIERTLLKNKSIKHCIVLFKDNVYKNSGTLIAYYLSDQKMSDSSIGLHCAKFLPEIMIPKHFIHLDKIPLNKNGKVDRLSLPIPVENNKNNNKMNLTQIQEKVLSVWKSMIKRKNIGVQDNFLNSGATSLNLFQFSNELKNVFTNQVSLADLFSYPNCEKLAKHIFLKK